MNGAGKETEHHHPVNNRETSIDASVAYAPRSHSQVDGFLLSGFGETTFSGEPLPVLNEACTCCGGKVGTWTDLTLTSSQPGGLFVTFGEDKYLLENPPTTTAATTTAA